MACLALWGQATGPRFAEIPWDSPGFDPVRHASLAGKGPSGVRDG
jgi:hypothetical protein